MLYSKAKKIGYPDTTFSNFRISIVASFALFLILATTPVFAAGDPWTSVGSAGTVDEADATEVHFSGGIASIKPSAPASSSVTLRYNITSTKDLEDSGVNKSLSVRFRDNGPDARVQLFLKSYNINTGAGTTVLSFDSNTTASSSSYRMQTVGDGCWKPSFDFHNNAYYIEAILTRTSTLGRPALSIMRVSDIDIC